MAANTMATDGEVLAELLCMVDNNPRPSLLFGAPALSVSQVETNLSLPSGALKAARLKAIIEPLADSLFDKPRKVTVRDLHRGGNVELWIVFEELALTERPSSAPKLAKLPPLNPHPQIASPQAKAGLGDRLRAVALQDAQKRQPDRRPDAISPGPSALTVTVSENGRDTSADIADVAVVELSGHHTADSIAMQAQDQERGFGEQSTVFFASKPAQARSARLDSNEQVEPSTPLEHSRSVSPRPHRAAADLIAASDLTDFIPEVNEDQNLVDPPSPLEDIEYDLKQGVNLDEDADGPTSYAARSPVDAFEFDMVDLLSPADVADPLSIELPRVDDISLEVERPPQAGPPDSPSPLLTPAVSPKWELQALAPIAASSRVSTYGWSPQLDKSAGRQPPQLEIIQPAGLVVDLDLPESSASSDDQFEFEVAGSSSSSGPHDGQGSRVSQLAYSADEAIEDRQSRNPNLYDVKRATEPNSADMANDDRAEWSAQALLARPEAQDISPPAGQSRSPHLAHYTSPLPSPLFLAYRVEASPCSTPPPTHRPVVDNDDYPSPAVEPFGRPELPEGMQDPRSLGRGEQIPDEALKRHEENGAQYGPMSASTISDRGSSFSLDDLLPPESDKEVDLASAQDSPSSPTSLSMGSVPTSPEPVATSMEDREDIMQGTHSSPPTSPARTDVSGSELDSNSGISRNGAPRHSAESITRNPPQTVQSINSSTRDAPDPSVSITPASGDVETPPVTPFVDKVFRDLPFAPRLPPPEALRQHGHWLAYELVAVLVVFLLLIPA